MVAGGFKTFSLDQVLTGQEINDFLMQGILVFANSSARDSAIGSPVAGQFSFLQSTDTVEYFDGSSWEEYSREPQSPVVSGTTGTWGTATVGSDTVYSLEGVTTFPARTGTITFSKNGFVRVLVVGAGEPGGGTTPIFNQEIPANTAKGGGAGGGVVEIAKFFVPAGTVSVRVGSPGGETSGVSFFGDLNVPGSSDPTRIVSLGPPFDFPTLIGPGSNGASGGGGAATATSFAGGSAISGVLGNNGGAGFGSSTNSQRAGGGGGGAGAVGNAAVTSTGGNGGAGYQSDIRGSNVFYGAGGGGGVVGSGGTAGLGGSSVGGAGGANAAGTAATGFGNGGGGGSNGNLSGNGSPGLVVIRISGA